MNSISTKLSHVPIFPSPRAARLVTGRLVTGRLATGLAAALVLLLVPTLASAETPRALGLNGDVYSLHIGPLAELIPDGSFNNPANTALVLEIAHADGSRERFLTPGTETWRPERDAILEVDPLTGVALVLWHAGAPDGTSSLHFSSFVDGEWRATDEIRRAGQTYFFSSTPRVLATRDRMDLTLDDDGGEPSTLTVGRTVLHVLWIEDDTDLVRYSPISFVDGVYVGWNEILTLSSAITKSHEDEEPPTGAGLPPLLDARVIEEGRALAVTLSESTYQRLAVLRIGVQPMSIQTLADEVLARILDVADPSLSQDVLDALTDELGARLIIIGLHMRLNPAVTDYVSLRLGEWIQENGGTYPGDLEGLGLAARAQTLDLGNSVYGRTIVDPSNPGQKIPEIDLGDFLDSNGHRAKLAELVQLEVRSDVDAPTIGADPAVYISGDGRSLLLAWEDSAGNRVHYVENHGHGWSEGLSLSVQEGLDSAAIRALFDAKVR